MNGHINALYELLQKEPILTSAEVEDIETARQTSFDPILSIRNISGRTALDEAQMLGNDEIAGILLKFSNLN